ncbi:sex peptide receptor-like [Diaphorina citri]|uniref:Sex peptide receptor-like n=1 Tax=Diaphorina citri TaxID=121845 RepID=A0A3Q0J608_DIACI|nr:sex peptide receptor-like [Diaphorina citri]
MECNLFNNTCTPSYDMNVSRENETYQYCGEHFQSFQMSYDHYHGYISLFVCIFGIVANTLNIIVLTRKEMRSPTNSILTGLAIADLLVMLDYIPFTLHLNIMNKSKRDKFNYNWTMFVLFHSNFSQVCHTISIYLTVVLAIWRYIAVVYPQHNRQWCTMKTTTVTILVGYIVCPLLCLPIYVTSKLKSRIVLLNQLDNNAVNYSVHPGGNQSDHNVTLYDETNSYNATLYFIDLVDYNLTNEIKLSVINFWIYSVVIKIIPCIALTVLSLRLIFALIETKKRREKLLTNKSKLNKTLEKEKRTDRTTKMLLAVLLLFLITEFPQGILGLLTIMLGKGFFTSCYIKLGALMDILALINSAINFILYCIMSRQFRVTFQAGKGFFTSCYIKLGALMDILALINSAINFILYCIMSRQFRVTFQA